MLLLGSPACGWGAWEAPLPPSEETEFFMVPGVAGILTLPVGAPDRRTPAIVILQDGQGPDGRARHYIDQLLGAGFAVLDVQTLETDALGRALSALSAHPRVTGQPIGLLGFGQGARLATQWSGAVAARALLYPGCGGLSPAAMAGEAVLLMYGTADPSNPSDACASFAHALGMAGASVRLRVFDQASYAWDRLAFGNEGRSRLRRPDGLSRVIAQPWPALAELSASNVAGFFAANLLAQRP
ncbi:MAG: Dienelactone hydrolase [Rhodospirillales bacterium]|jgi:hypothetical protein|nr:Dienelactone hydrolase [Rhodospirillales bacterium]